MKQKELEEKPNQWTPWQPRKRCGNKKQGLLATLAPPTNNFTPGFSMIGCMGSKESWTTTNQTKGQKLQSKPLISKMNFRTKEKLATILQPCSPMSKISIVSEPKTSKKKGNCEGKLCLVCQRKSCNSKTI